jgi:ribosomal protein S18 acetylase RimI-like enzyme
MSPVKTVSQVFDAIQQAKTGASAFCTNFFPMQSKLEGWIRHDELLSEIRDGAAFFLRKDRDFWHLYFCAANMPALQRELAGLRNAQTDPIVLDLIGKETMLADLLRLFETSGFRRYARLVRLTRSSLSSSEGERARVTGLESPNAPELTFAQATDSEAISTLLGSSFDRYADQLPSPYELQDAIAHHNILTAKMNGTLAALLFSETHGLTSTVRYWAVAEQFRALRLGSILMRHYFAAQNAVRRFLLWVAASNENALQKYQHYGYAPDGLVDHVLANSLIRP